MGTISLRVNESDYNLIQSYISMNNLNLSAFIREAVLDKIEDDLRLDEERLIKYRTLLKKEPVYDHTEVWDMLEV